MECNLKNTATCLRLLFKDYLKEDVNSDRKIDTQSPFDMCAPIVARGVRSAAHPRAAPTFSHLHGSPNRAV